MNSICIIGGGLAGLVTALAARRYGYQVIVLEAGDYSGYRAGEHMAVRGVNALVGLGVPANIIDANAVACQAIKSIWGSDDIQYRDRLLNPEGDGIVLTRPDFDRVLADFVRSTGVSVHTLARVTGLTERRNRWYITFSVYDETRETVADYIVDASGRNTAMTSKLGVRKIKYDNLMAISHFKPATDVTRRNSGNVLIEASRHGWFYSTTRKDGVSILSFMTDSDVIQEYGSIRNAIPVYYSTSRTRNVLGIDHPDDAGEQITVSARTQILDRMFGDRWLAVGDAAWSADPLSSSGITRAILGGICAANAIHEKASGHSASLASYERQFRENFNQYLMQRSGYYRMETRWGGEMFWKRRHQLNWQEAPVKIHPQRKTGLITGALVASRKRIRQLTPGIDSELLIDAVRENNLACDVVEYYQNHASGHASDREIIVALQEILV